MTASAPALLPATQDALLRHVATVQSRTRQPSLVAAVVRDGRLVWWASRGSETGLGDDQDAGPDLQYRIGSITKSLTAVTVLQCRDDGLLGLDDRLDTYVPDTAFGSATLRRLLSHSAAVPAEPAGPWWERHDDADLEDLFGRTRDQQQVLDGRAEHHYSNLGYALLGAVVARVRGAGWFDVVRHRVLDPLGMTRTTYAPQAPHAHGRSVHPHTGRLEPEPHTDTGAMAPAGQLWSTVQDLTRLAMFWIDPVADVLAAPTVQEMTTVSAAVSSDLPDAYGMGLQVTPAADGTRVGHSGSMPGFLAGLVAAPAARVAAVALSNGTTGGTPMLPGLLIDQLLTDEPATAPAWHPEPVVDGADELVGWWYWGNTALAFAVRDGRLCLDHDRPARRTRFEREGPDRWCGLDSYFAGETMTVVRDDAGQVSKLVLATYELLRRPYGR